MLETPGQAQVTQADKAPQTRGFSAMPEGRSGHEVVATLATLGCSGTLYIEGEGGALLVVVRDGKVEAEHALSPKAALAAACRYLRFSPLLDARNLPRLPSQAPNSPVAALRALPELATDRALEAGLLDFRALLAHYGERGQSGALALRAGADEGLVLLHKGRPQAAAYGRENRVVSGAQALRAMYQATLPEASLPEASLPSATLPSATLPGAERAGGRLSLHALPSALVAALAGVALEHAPTASSADLTTFTGVEVNRRGYLFYTRGAPYLLVEAPTMGLPRLYAATSGGEALELPDKPSGWEKRHYKLTLRGHDALNPMTDLYLQFESHYGRSGNLLLRALQASTATAQLESKLGLDEESLRELIEKLERGGLIRGS